MKNTEAKRIKKEQESGTLTELIAHITALSSQFLRHSYNKREQSESLSCKIYREH